MEEPPTKKPKVEDEDVSSREANKKLIAESSSKERRGHLREADVGIICYITSGFKPIVGVVKQRFSDFIVNEVDMNGEVVRLTTMSAKDCIGISQTDDTSRKSDSGDVCPIPAAVLKELKDLVEDDEKEKCVKIEAPVKAERKAIHVYIKDHFTGMDSNCVEVEGVKYLEFKLKSGASRTKREAAWPKDRQHLRFTLYKEFKDTMEAIDIISKYSGIKAQQFNYAGTKDRRAKTSQRVSLFKVDARKLEKTNTKLRGMVLGNFEYSKEKISLGQLAGNRFKVVVRNVETTTDNVFDMTQSLQSLGFINYFGMQRFGTTSTPTYEIGLHILKGLLTKAIDLIMASRDGELPQATEAKIAWVEKRNAKEALLKLPKSCNIERRLMQGVVSSSEDSLHSALAAIPRTTRLLYLHSYQSLIWNRVASLRIQKYGLMPLAGDLIYIKDYNSSTHNSEEDNIIDREQLTKSQVRHLSADELKNYTIYDVVIPLPGYNIILPENETGEMITELLKEQNLSITSLKCAGKLKEYSLPGSYRHLVVKPKQLSSSLSHYDDVTEELVQSDLDILNKKSLVIKHSGKFQALILEFSLPSSSYATMLLREVMRVDTSAAHQASLNQMRQTDP
ncbi:pseudouridylate synthase 7 homolog isoform X1 [Watersipora subatra]|uniref:pseudouridylate synthase 7 homolog isoform X1 n=1 Tax=Watersipora subatra TaxID=2589382 RepID=UPI00355C75FC